MLLLGKTVIEDFKRSHADWRKRLDAFVAIVEKARWKNPVELKNALGSADPVGPFYVIDVGGKKGIRVSIIVKFADETLIVHKIFADHDEYQKWSVGVKAQHEQNRKRGKK